MDRIIFEFSSESISADLKDFKLTYDDTLNPTAKFFKTDWSGKFNVSGSIDWRISPTPGFTVRPTYMNIPRGFYTPKQLGLDFPRCSQISIGYCSLLSSWKKKLTWHGWEWYIEDGGGFGRELAHAHDTRICLTNGRHVYSAEGVPDEVMLHEYAHILSDCLLHGHDSVWQDKAKELGLKNPGPFTHHIYAGDPIAQWNPA